MLYRTRAAGLGFGVGIPLFYAAVHASRMAENRGSVEGFLGLAMMGLILWGIITLIQIHVELCERRYASTSLSLGNEGLRISSVRPSADRCWSESDPRDASGIASAIRSSSRSSS